MHVLRFFTFVIRGLDEGEGMEAKNEEWRDGELTFFAEGSEHGL